MLLKKLLKKVKDCYESRCSKDEHEECFTQAYKSVPDNITEKNYLNAVPYKMEPSKPYLKDPELDEYDCSRTK